MNQYRILFAEQIVTLLQESLAAAEATLSVEDVVNMMEYPPNEEMGDLSFPCFRLSKSLRKGPPQIAAMLQESFPSSDWVEKTVAISGYLNVYIDKHAFVTNSLQTILNSGDQYGSALIGEGKQVVIDYSSPNIAKPFHVGHLRSTAIGNALYQMLSFVGYQCVGVNHLGDWGTQFGKLIVAYKMWGDEDAVNEGGVKELVRLYVKFHEEAEDNPSLEDVARAWFVNLEEADSEATYLWQWFRNISLKEFQRVYDLMKVSFDSFAGESFYNDKMGVVINELIAKQLLKEDDGAQLVDLEQYGMPPCLILKKDGSSLYATRDIAAALYRKKKYDSSKIIYVTGGTQSLHFQQWFKVVELMGYEWAGSELFHVPFGQVSLEGAKIATRKGNVVLLEDIFAQAIDKVMEKIDENNPNLENKEEVARQVGVGAIVFSDLSTNRIKDVIFSWDEVLNFEGETGPYVQYTYARASSVMRKAAEANVDKSIAELLSVDASQLLDDTTISLFKTLQQFPEKILQACDKLEPSLVTRYLVDVAQSFNRFYRDCPILKVENEALRSARLAVVQCTRLVLANGLRLIGIETPERM
jgi:arginyl-tRNA synthetase